MTALLFALASAPVLLVNEIGYETIGPKEAILRTDQSFVGRPEFQVLAGDKVVLKGRLGSAVKIESWEQDKQFFRADFSALSRPGRYTLQVTVDGLSVRSAEFEVGNDVLAKTTVPAILGYYRKQRADTPTELAADAKVRLYGSEQTVDLRGGWCDASGDVSKYFSHLAYANFMSPQQTPLVVWSLANAREKLPKSLGAATSAEAEALYGADYLMRSLSKDDFFYMIVFSYFDKNPDARRVVGLHADSVTTNEYQSAFREGGGMAIAALARVSRWKRDGDFTSAQYLSGAKRAFAHLLSNNRRYDDDGKENIIDDYGALMAATELWAATSDVQYRDEARKRAGDMANRMTPQGYFRADDGTRPFWHGSDAGLPVVALARYLDVEKEASFRKPALATIKKALDYELRVTDEVPNPFGYARQTFHFRGAIQDGFFIPHENETGWWWQGESARLGSLATAAIVGGRLVYPGSGAWGVKPALAAFATRQLDWILGRNPYAMCLMYGFGKNNVPFMKSNFGHGSEKGGISNGITGQNADGSGLAFKTSDNGNEWRWTEQWIPHAAWFLQATTAMSGRR